MNLIEVNSKKQIKEFILLPVGLYKNEKNWIRPLDKDIEAVFDLQKNKSFKYGKCMRWILHNDQGKTIGRIAAFTNSKTANKDNDQPTGGVGFFDCIDNQEAANILFDKGKSWLEEQGMEAMDGPVNFGERDKNWGVLIDGFAEQNYGMLYNAPYYQKLYEGYGFKLYFNQLTYGRDVQKTKDFDPRFYERAQQALNNPDITFRYIKKKNFDKAAVYFHEVYSKAWGGHSGVKPMTLEQAQKMFGKLKPIADDKLIYFGFYKDEPISFFLSIPELNQLFKYVDGNMNWLGKLKFAYHMKMGHCKKMLGLVFGVIPEWHGKGVESAMVVSYSDIAWNKGLPYKTIEMNWIGDFNPKMMKVCEQLGAEVWRTHATYRYLFDREKPFERCPIVA